MKRSRVLGLTLLIVAVGGLISFLYRPHQANAPSQKQDSLVIPKAVPSPDKADVVQPPDNKIGEPAVAGSTTPTVAAVKNSPGISVQQLYECRDVPENETDLQGRLEVLKELERKEQVNYQTMMLAAIAAYEKCKAIPPEIWRSRTEVLAKSADSGDDEEKLKFVNDGMPDASDSESFALYQEKSREYLKLLLGKGNPAALRAKANAYSRGSAYPRDPAQAYSHMFAYALAEPRDEQVSAALAIVEARMDPRVVEALRAVGSDLAKCCAN